MTGESPIKPGDHVRTPLARLAEVIRVRPDGKRDLVYLDGDGGEVALDVRQLALVRSARVRPWPSRLP